TAGLHLVRQSREPTAKTNSHHHKHIITFDLDGIYRDTSGWIVRRLAGFRIPLPGVPGTDELSVFNHALPQRTAPVQTDVIDCRHRPIDIRDTDHSPSDGNLPRLPR